MVEIMQETEACSTTNYPGCLAHPSRSISHICMLCEVGLCSQCIVSAMKEHIGHEILEIEDAFEKTKQRVDTVTEKGKKACQLLNAEFQAIPEKKTAIESCSTDLASAHASKNISMFGLLRKLAALLDTTGNKSQNLEVVTEDIPDNNCTNESLKLAVESFHHGMSTMKSTNGTSKARATACQKLAAITSLIDLLRMDIKHEGLQTTLTYLRKLCNQSEACCHRVVLLGGANLLISCFEASTTKDESCRRVLLVYGMLAGYPALHADLVSSKAINMLEFSIKNFTRCKISACKSLSFFLSNPGLIWPKQCLTSEEISALVIETCKQLSLKEPAGGDCISFRTHVSLLSQSVSEAAKHWPVWALYLFTDQHPDLYCPMLARDGGVTALKQQKHAHEYVQRLAKTILKKFEENSS